MLNTGERVFVHRQLTYERAGAPGNPLEMEWAVKRGGEMSFAWKGRQYVFKEHNAPLVLAISPRGTPVVVVNAALGRWDARNNYGCKTPHYVQFEADASGKHWTWPPAVEPWVIGLPANLLRRVPRPTDHRAQDSAAEVRAVADAATYGSYERFVDPGFKPDYCNRKGS